MDEVERRLAKEGDLVTIFGMISSILVVLAICSLLDFKIETFIMAVIPTALSILMTIILNNSYDKHAENIADHNYTVEQDIIKGFTSDEDNCFVKLQNARCNISISWETRKKLSKGEQISVLYFNGERKPYSIVI